MAVAAVIIITVGVMAVVMAVVMAAAVVMAPGKGSGENPEKSSLRKEGGFPLGFLMREGVRVGVIGVPLNISPAQKERQDVKRGAACLLPEDRDRARIGREAGPKREDRRGVLYIKSYEVFLKKLIKNYINLLRIN